MLACLDAYSNEAGVAELRRKLDRRTPQEILDHVLILEGDEYLEVRKRDSPVFRDPATIVLSVRL